MTPADSSSQQAARIVNQYLVCSDATYLEHLIAAAIEQARREEREAALDYIAEHGVPVTSVEMDRYYRARAQESE